MSDLLSEHRCYIEGLRQRRFPVVSYYCPDCNAEIETLDNKTSLTWDTLSACPHCRQIHVKYTYQGWAQGVSLKD